MMMSDEKPAGSKHCPFIFGQDTFKPTVRAVPENPGRYVLRSDNWEAASAISSA